MSCDFQPTITTFTLYCRLFLCQVVLVLCMKLLVLFAKGHLAAAAVCGWTKDGAEGGVCFYAEAQTKDRTKCPDSMGDIRVSFCRI